MAKTAAQTKLRTLDELRSKVFEYVHDRGDSVDDVRDRLQERNSDNAFSYILSLEMPTLLKLLKIYKDENGD